MDRESFLSRASKPATKEVTLDDGSTVNVRKLTQKEVEQVKRNYGTEATALEGFRFIVSRCLVNEDGERVLTDQDKEKLAEIDFDAIEAIAHEVVEFSGLNRRRQPGKA